jgi:hypothetical protein
MYNVDMTKPFPYRDNYRSTTLLAYLNDVPPGGGGETEFMMATPRPFTVPPREGAALVWANCELENVPTIDTRRPGDVWDEGRCMGGAGPHDMRRTRRVPCRVNTRNGLVAWVGSFGACTSRGPSVAARRSGR